MKGGFYNPPNHEAVGSDAQGAGASMKGGFYNPPNPPTRPLLPAYQLSFNEGGVL